MNEDVQNVSETDGQVRLDENAACDVCGKFGAFHFGERTLCPECYTGCGSCCPEFEKDDLWAGQTAK
ncbi:MAG TPA: hypothetical protein VFY06_15105 [Verrucomicrobiae bacterium]|nr:hypothetical protein [Verrucomicrobiae bacterium]